jgi:hypothetical protein
MISPIMSIDPGMTNAKVQMALIEINGDASENSKPETQLEGDEFIEVISVPLVDLMGKLHGRS